GLDFGNQSGTVTGTTFQDVNGNGARDPGELSLAGWVIYDDRNNNGVLDSGEPSVLTDAAGNYTFANLGPSIHVIREVLQPGWRPTAPAAGFYSVSLAMGQDWTGLDFGNQTVNPGSIAGQAFRDLNGNGVKDAGEPGLAGWTHFLDLNNNGALDPAEPRV